MRRKSGSVAEAAQLATEEERGLGVDDPARAITLLYAHASHEQFAAQPPEQAQLTAKANALAESFVDSFKTELITDRVWRTRSQLTRPGVVPDWTKPAT